MGGQEHSEEVLVVLLDMHSLLWVVYQTPHFYQYAYALRYRTHVLPVLSLEAAKTSMREASTH